MKTKKRTDVRYEEEKRDGSGNSRRKETSEVDKLTDRQIDK